MIVKGRIIGGRGRATRLGFPTFNMVLPKGIEGGVYSGIAKFIDNTYKAVLFADTKRMVLEAHLLDFKIEDRESEIEIEVLDKIRETKVFESDKELVEQIEKDVRGVT